MIYIRKFNNASEFDEELATLQAPWLVFINDDDKCQCQDITKRYFKCITNINDLTDGKYLIVCQSTKSTTPIPHIYVLDASLLNMDTTGNHYSLPMEAYDPVLDLIYYSQELSKCIFTITKTENGYTIQDQLKRYIGSNTKSNELKTVYEPPLYNTFEFSGASGNICNFNGNTPSNTLVVIASGNYSNSKGTVTYEDITYNVCVKMESSTDIVITPVANCNITLIFGGTTDAGGKRYSLNSETRILDNNGYDTFNADAGTEYHVKKVDTINIFLIVFEDNNRAVLNNTISLDAKTAKVMCNNHYLRHYHGTETDPEDDRFRYYTTESSTTWPVIIYKYTEE